MCRVLLILATYTGTAEGLVFFWGPQLREISVGGFRLEVFREHLDHQDNEDVLNLVGVKKRRASKFSEKNEL